MASNVFAHSDKLKEMAECMLNLLSKRNYSYRGSYLMNTLKDLTFDNIYHEHYNYWSLTSLVYFFNQFNAKILDLREYTHGGSIRIYKKRQNQDRIKCEKNA